MAWVHTIVHMILVGTRRKSSGNELERFVIGGILVLHGLGLRARGLGFRVKDSKW